jgi:hypothetical protein
VKGVAMKYAAFAFRKTTSKTTKKRTKFGGGPNYKLSLAENRLKIGNNKLNVLAKETAEELTLILQ